MYKKLKKRFVVFFEIVITSIEFFLNPRSNHSLTYNLINPIYTHLFELLKNRKLESGAIYGGSLQMKSRYNNRYKKV